jgi:hypothetical protein
LTIDVKHSGEADDDFDAGLVNLTGAGMGARQGPTRN